MVLWDAAAFFIVTNAKKIEEYVGITPPFSDNATGIITSFLIKQNDELNAKYKTIYDAFDDEDFRAEILNLLKNAKKCGIKLEETRIGYVT